jgi:hypothetical protein
VIEMQPGFRTDADNELCIGDKRVDELVLENDRFVGVRVRCHHRA